MSKGTTILSDLLSVLGVEHTGRYSDRRFHEMSFKSLFGFSRLLGEYGVESEGLRLSDNGVIAGFETPFVAETNSGFVIVKNADKTNGVDYTLYHKELHDSFDDFVSKMMTGVVLLVAPTADAKEPDFSRHVVCELISATKVAVLAVCAVALFVAGAVSSGIFRHLSSILLTAVTLVGVGVTWLLILKSLKVHSHSADRICGILQEHGCDTVLEQKASSFFGIFSWSEVGISYFSVTMVILLLFPSQIHSLALINGCCLPFTVWSIWYQRFRIHTWCTLCVTTQCLLWLQFFCYLGGGWWHGAFPISPYILLDVAAYGFTLLGVNRVMTFIKRNTLNANEHEEN